MGCKLSKDGIKYKMVLLKIQRVLVRKERRELVEKYEKITGKKVVLRKIRDYVADKEERNVKGRTRKGKVEITLGNKKRKNGVKKCKKKIQKRKRFYDEDKIVIDKQEGFCSINKVNDWVVDKQKHLRKQMMMITPLKRNNNNYVIEDSNNISFSNNSNCNCISNDQTTDKSTTIKQQIQSSSSTTNNFSINNNIQHKLNISTFPNINITTTTTNINTIKYTPPTQLKNLLYKHQIISGLKKQLPFEESIETE